MYYIYMLRCMDESIYTGITTDLDRRMKEHFSKEEKCSKYTFRHTAKILEIAWQTENRKLASKLEYYIKTLKKVQKEEIIKTPERLEVYLGDKINCEFYKIVNLKK